MRARGRIWLLLPLSAVFAAEPVMAFTYPLSSEAIREAYFLGTGDPAKRADVFAKYAHTFPVPTTGPYVEFVRFETPYLFVADQVGQNAANLRAPDAEQDFLGKPVNCHVIVQVYFPYNEYDNFTVQLTQDGRKIQSLSKHGSFLYAVEGEPWPAGIQMDLQYAASDIDPDKTANVQISIDNGPTVQATFDLSQLR
jgi:hypothetical protein